MASEATKEWMEMSDQSLKAADLLFKDGHWRSCVSRSYYSAMASTHAVLFSLRKTPPHRGNWPNAGLSVVLRDCLVDVSLSKQEKANAERYGDSLRTCWNLRIDADYKPFRVVSKESASLAMKHADALRNLRKRMGL